jgi:YacP-like NYN domain
MGATCDDRGSGPADPGWEPAGGVPVGGACEDAPSFGRGVLEALAVPALFVALGIAAAAWVGRAAPQPAPYPPALMDPVLEEAAPTPAPVWLVDGFNVVHVALRAGAEARREGDAWWGSRLRGALLERVAGFDDPGAEIWVVFDGPRPVPGAQAPSPRLRQVFAPSADDWLLARLRAEPDPRRVAVVTADGRLAGRARRRGARVVTPAEFLRRCRVAAPPADGEGPAPRPSELG